ncbi:Gfo/Idh/MocA family protein [Cellulosilyticum ruminicola]|uniref:Gfo/Idh/MocA family protein n=1 Tax=Cellulosilyticum ruminicola TaxID=425254 RepID=UPI0006D204E6|nr:Gfo/Idh/MocA family oxidoreductase [Cellulosilyticum ruminicola]
MKNIGILGCSMITPVSLLAPIKECETLKIYGIAGRNYDRAKVYAEKYSIENVYASYEDLLADENIDIVYIPLANYVHKEWIIKSAKAKKHILVEKPICLKSEDLGDIEEACKANGVCLVEGIMARHHQWQGYIKELIDNKVYGKLKHIQTNLVFEAPVPEGESYRNHMTCGGGVFWDIASYWIQFLQEVLGLEKISTYEGASKFDGPNGCDWDFDAKVSYENGVTSSLHGAFAKPYEADYIVTFEEAEFS